MKKELQHGTEGILDGMTLGFWNIIRTRANVGGIDFKGPHDRYHTLDTSSYIFGTKPYMWAGRVAGATALGLVAEHYIGGPFHGDVTLDSGIDSMGSVDVEDWVMNAGIVSLGSFISVLLAMKVSNNISYKYLYKNLP